jgi:acetyl-CoA carboxylase carboxyl transferase subunit alpha
VADRVLMLENSIYSVASPEGSASILWKDAGKAPEAAERMRITAHDLLEFGIIDEVIPEAVPAHDDPRAAIQATGDCIKAHLRDLIAAYPLHDAEALDRLITARYTRFRSIGSWREDGIS